MSHDGRQLAVKVQHVGLRDTCAADTVIVEAFVKGLRWVFPDFNYQWLIDELKESVPKVQHKHLSFLASWLSTQAILLDCLCCCLYQSVETVTHHPLSPGGFMLVHAGLLLFLHFWFCPKARFLCIQHECTLQHMKPQHMSAIAATFVFVMVSLPVPHTFIYIATQLSLGARGPCIEKLNALVLYYTTSSMHASRPCVCISIENEPSLVALQELDFELEVANSKRCQLHLNSKKSRVKGKVVVPQVEDGMFNKRVLVMEYIEGFKVTDRSDMHAHQGTTLEQGGLPPENACKLGLVHQSRAGAAE